MPALPPQSPGPRRPGTGATRQLPEWQRAMVGAALAMYLVGLALSIVASGGRESSAVVRVVRGRLFSPWMVPPWLDLGFDYRLTHGGPEDGAHVIEVVARTEPRGTPLRLPGGATGERASRWGRLGRAVAADRDEADRDGLLTAAIGRWSFHELGTEDVVVGVARTPPVEFNAEPEPATRALSARVRMVGGDLQLLRSEPPGEVAPLVRPAVSDAGSSGDNSR